MTTTVNQVALAVLAWPTPSLPTIIVTLHTPPCPARRTGADLTESQVPPSLPGVPIPSTRSSVQTDMPRHR